MVVTTLQFIDLVELEVAWCTIAIKNFQLDLGIRVYSNFDSWCGFGDGMNHESSCLIWGNMMYEQTRCNIEDEITTFLRTLGF